MKRYSILALVAAMAMTASAQTTLMRVHAKDGTITTFPVDDVALVDFEQQDEPGANDVNLGGGANAYIVSKAANYQFVASHVDGTPIAGIDHVDWLWREKSGGELVSDVSYDNGIVRFTSNGEEGNAVLAAVDARGKIVWVWHIWCTDEPADVQMGNTVIMDRHLGAVSNDPADGRDTWGLVYQYGRNVPFYFIGDNQEYNPQDAFVQANKFTEINPAFPGMKWKTDSYSRSEGYSIEESMANPLTHFIHEYVSGSNGGYHWAQDDKVFEYAWGGQNVITKTNYDPCPKGYKVPFADQLDFSNISYEPNPTFDMAYPIPGFYVDGQWWPMNTGRHYEDGCALYGGQAKEYCDRLFLWTAYGDEFRLNFFTYYEFCPIRVIIDNDYKNGELSVTNPTAGAGAFGHTIRCVREGGSPAAVPEVKPGQMAANFTLTLADGTEKQLADVTKQTKQTLLYFNNPECAACVDMKAALQHSPAIQARLADGTLSIVSIYTDDEPEMWRSHAADYPAQWTVAYDAPQRVLTEGLYDMSSTPALYLVDSKGHILLANADLTAVEALVK